MAKLSIEAETLEILNAARRKSDSVLVSFSGGRDSLVVTDLCLRVFDRVEGFFMQVVPGLETVEGPAIEAAARFGMKLHMTPHWIAFRLKRYGIYGFEPREREDWPEIKIRDIYALMIAETGISVIATGAKRVDSIWRKRYLDSTKAWTEVINPVVGWSKHEIAAYLLSHKIPLPQGSTGRSELGAEEAKAAGGIDLSKGAVCLLYDRSPSDYALLEAEFPFVGAIIKQREMSRGR